MNCSTPGFPVLHYLPDLAQTHVHRVGDAIQPSHTILYCPLLLLPSILRVIRHFLVARQSNQQLFALNQAEKLSVTTRRYDLSG